MNSLIIILACGGIFAFFILLFGFLLLLRYIHYKENTKLAESGLLPMRSPRRNRALLVIGWLAAILGLFTSLAAWVVGVKFIDVASAFPLALGPWVLIGLIPLFFGLCMLFLYVLLAPGSTPA